MTRAFRGGAPRQTTDASRGEPPTGSISLQGFRPGHVFAAILRRATGLRVRSGPFAGMRYVDSSVGSVYAPKLLGTYELELHAVLEEAISLRPRHVVDVGAAEGYYAVGMLLRGAGRVTAFEQGVSGRRLMRELAECNAVLDRLEVLGRCDPEGLQQVVQAAETAVLICDVEGNELELLDPEVVPALRGVRMLVEAHDHQVPECTTTLLRRFARTHSVTIVRQRARVPADFPFATALTRLFPWAVMRYGLCEYRPSANQWLWFRPTND